MSERQFAAVGRLTDRVPGLAIGALSRAATLGLLIAWAAPLAPQAVATELATLHTLAERMQQESGAPAVFLAAGKVGAEPLVAAAGCRKDGDETAVTPDDCVHLGSCTKALTALLVARLVEQGRLDWNDSLATRAPQLAAELPASHRTVTIAQLLQHRSGLPANARDWWLYRGRHVSEFRREILVDSLAQAELQPAGSQELYSNLGYMTAGLIAEYATGRSWEALMQQEVFGPLGLRSAGFGAPSILESVAQPWGHQREGGSLQASQQDNAAALGPAGTVHMAMSDWFRCCGVFAGACPEGFLGEDSVRRLVTPDLNAEYAYGWGVVDRDWAQGPVLLHAGSNRWWYCKACVAPALGRVYLCAFNLGGDEMEEWAERSLAALIALSR